MSAVAPILANLRAIHNGLVTLHNGLCPARPAHLPHPGQCAARVAAMREHCREIKADRNEARLARERNNRKARRNATPTGNREP